MTTEDTERVRVLWPDGPRWLTEEEIVCYAIDHWWESAERFRCRECGAVTVREDFGRPAATVRPGEFLASDPAHPCECEGDTEPLHGDDQPRPIGLSESVDYLESHGLMTFGKGGDR